MELDEIMQYSHKIKKIYIKNDNKASEFDSVIIKININDKKDNEIIRFSVQEYSEWLNHQQSDNDYFLEIPNKLESTLTLYAHYFPVALYDYLDEQQIFSIYDWSELVEEMPISQYHNQTYHINEGEATIDENTYLTDGNKLHINNETYTIEYNGTKIGDNIYYIRNGKLIINGYTYHKNVTSNQYDYALDNEDKLVVRSLLTNSIDKYKNPNYKNYTKLIEDNSISNATSKGHFPLSSRYRGYKYLNAPDINQNPLPYWSNTNASPLDCTRENDAPYWQAKIHKRGLSPLISDTQDGKYSPLNVYLNYEYLPSSTEYHQHYYGFEPKNPDNENGMYEKAPNNTFLVLDGENLTKINKQFGKESTYRIINQGNPFESNNTNTMTVPHDKVIPINLNEGLPTRDSNDNYTCKWDYNTCYGYYVYTPNGAGHVAINVELEEDEIYKLQYYMYIPSESIVEDDSCTVTVEHRNENGVITSIDELPSNVKDILLRQDKILRDQWIYHEIDFKADQNNRICIKGPQHKKTDTVINKVDGSTYTKAHYQTINDDNVYFVNFRLIKMGEYSPTLKYTETGVYLVEQDKYALKSTSEQSNECVSTKTGSEYIPLWTDTDNLPTPIKDVYFVFDGDFDILYNDISSDLSWTSNIENCVFKFAPYDSYKGVGKIQWETDDNEISLIYDTLTKNNNIVTHSSTDNQQGRMELFRRQKKVFTTGANNSFTLLLQDSAGNKVTNGEVECAIVKTLADDGRYSQDDRERPCNDPSVMCLGKRQPDKYGEVTYTNLNFKNLQPSDEEVTYFLRITYTNPCYDRKIIHFKALLFEREHRNMNAYVNLSNEYICNDKPKISEVTSYIENHTKQLCNLCAISEYSKSSHKYIQYQSDFTIKEATQLPLRIDVNVYNQLGVSLKDDGYCELSINDEVKQSTIIDTNGVADFYIDYNDIYNGIPNNNITEQVIKIEYFNKYYEPINFLYFTIKYDIAGGYDSRPAIPIKLYSISSNSLMVLNSPEYHMKNKDEIFMLNIDTEDNSNFSIGIILNGTEITRKEIYSSTDTFIITGKYNNRPRDEYIIYTDNLIGYETDGNYRRNQRKFYVVWS